MCIHIGWSPYGEKGIVPVVSESSRTFDFPDWRQQTLRVCLWPSEVPTARLFLPKSVQKCLTYGPRTAPVRPLEDIPKPRREHSKGTRFIDAVDPTIRPASQTNCLPPTVFSFEEVVPSMKIYLLERYLLPALRSTCMTHLSRYSAAPITRVLPSDIYNSASRCLCIKFCSTRVKDG